MINVSGRYKCNDEQQEADECWRVEGVEVFFSTKNIFNQMFIKQIAIKELRSQGVIFVSFFFKKENF